MPRRAAAQRDAIAKPRRGAPVGFSNPDSSPPVRHGLTAMRRVLLILASATLAIGCAHGRRPASYLPVGAAAQYGDSTMDGVVLLLSASEAQARIAISRALLSTGYEATWSSSRARVLETPMQSVARDTTMRVSVELTPPEQAGGHTIVVFTGRYSVPSRRILNAWVIQRPGESDPLYRRLGAIADSTRKFIAASP